MSYCMQNTAGGADHHDSEEETALEALQDLSNAGSMGTTSIQALQALLRRAGLLAAAGNPVAGTLVAAQVGSRATANTL
jgi:hypothetical protein